MGLKLHGIHMSTCTARVLSCAYEKDAAVELVPVNLQTGEHKSPDYLATKNVSCLSLFDCRVEIFG